jgi:hypothetical protein
MSCPSCNGTLRDEKGNICKTCGGTGWGVSEYAMLKLVLLLLLGAAFYWVAVEEHAANQKATGFLLILILFTLGTLVRDLWSYLKSRPKM